MSRIVITGPTGAVGIALIRAALDEGHDVVALCHRGSRRIARVPQNAHVRVVEFDLDHMHEVAEGIEGPCDIFYHLAWAGTVGDARNDMFLQNANVRHTLDAVNLAEALGCTAFVGAGSQAEYGRFEGLLAPDTPVKPENGYGMAKLCAGQMSRVMCQKRGMRHVWPRILSIYGPFDGERTMVISTIRALLAGRKPSFTPGEQLWDYLYADDAGRALLLAGLKGADGAVYCIGSGQAAPLKSYVEQIRDAVDPALELGIGEVPYAEKQVMHLQADISTLTADTGFQPCVPFKEGIARTVAWCREHADEETSG